MKLYAEEEGQHAVRSIVDLIVVSVLARIEVPAALWRKHRIAELGAVEAAVLVGDFESDWFGTPGSRARFRVVVLRPSLLDVAARHVAMHGLRAYEAVQLASAVAARDADPGCDTFACFDSSLRTAAAVSGFTLYPG